MTGQTLPYRTTADQGSHQESQPASRIGDGRMMDTTGESVRSERNFPRKKGEEIETPVSLKM
jgi:hypothetical protein